MAQYVNRVKEKQSVYDSPDLIILWSSANSIPIDTIDR